MGTLAGAALRLKELGAPWGRLQLLNTHPEIQKQFAELGLDRLFDL